MYLAEDINENQLVAVKILYPQYSEDIAYIQRFNREAKLAHSLNNEHIVRVLDYGASRDVHYLVMEYVEGKDLRQILDDRGPLPLDEACGILDQVCAALEHAHAFGIVHRDIKPQNLMLTGSGQIKVLDFGIARARTLPSLTQSGFVGSPYYIAPEQAMGDEVDIRADLYSAGIVFYELLSGRVPFDDKSPWAIISQHIASDPPPLNLPLGGQAEVVERFLRRSIAKRPDDRFQTPTAMRQTIAAILKGQPMPDELGTPPPLSTRTVAMADTLYERALESMRNKDWQRAVDLLNQVINLASDHTQAVEKLKEAGREARLEALYQAAERALEAGRWQEALDELNEILSIEANYRQAAELRVRARSAIERQEVYGRVKDLYEKGKRHFEAGEWTLAMAALSQVQKIAPGYQRTAELLAEANRRRQPSRFSQITRGIKLKQPGGQQVRWLLGTLLLAALIVGAVWVVSQNPNLTTARGADPLREPYAQAQAAIAEEDVDQALILLEQILAQDPGYRDAAALHQHLLQAASLADKLATARQAVEDQRWSNAITLLDQVRAEDEAFVPDDVATLFCRAYLGRGQDRMAGIQSTRDRATVQAAIADLEAGQRECPPEQTQILDQVLVTARTYLAVVEAADDPAVVIDRLGPLVEADPSYAGGQARVLLYEAYLARGDALFRAQNLDQALADYELALALGVDDPAAAQTRRAEVLAAIEASESGPVATPPADPSAAATPAATPTPAPTLAYVYAAPLPVGPANEAVFGGRFAVIELEWEPVGQLAADEYYDVTVMHFVGEEPRYWGAPLTDTKWRVPLEAGYGEAGEDRFYWWVTVRRANTAPGPGQLDQPVSPPSEAQTFYWRP